MTKDTLHLKVRGVALWINTLQSEAPAIVSSAFETLLEASDALATSTPIKWPEKEKGLVLSMHGEGWNSAIDACRRAVEGKK